MTHRGISCYSAAIVLSAVGACEPDVASLSIHYGTGTSEGGTVSSGMPPSRGGASSSETGGGGKQGEGGGTEDGGQAGSPMGGSTHEPDPCSDLRRNAGETDVDCGGDTDCPRCEVDARCKSNSDCDTDLCISSRCSEPSCDDRVQNQDETGIDCGGVCSDRSRCSLESSCRVHTDCESEFCSARVCRDHCDSRHREADETDVDCGGASCDRCPEGKACTQRKDCQSDVCTNGKCVAPSCEDDLRNQNESDIDCGGVCAPTHACGMGRRCNSASDCETYVCAMNRCANDITVALEDVIDDFDDGDLSLPSHSGRLGNWFSFSDKTSQSVLKIADDARPNSKYSLVYSGEGFTDWGSGIGFDFNNPGFEEGTKVPWDGTGHSALSFWAKAAMPTTIKVQLADRNTHFRGGVCTTCGHYWFKSIGISDEWKRYTIPFIDLVEEVGTEPPPPAFDVTGIVMFQIFMTAGIKFELAIDDIALLR
ncbi:MAG TPA: carbohydrate binding domain-containing protein [Polyangiaceae bacterium]|nr:carbohydrate binding domain-containing protein [Polyangiaceae bacterium]